VLAIVDVDLAWPEHLLSVLWNILWLDDLLLNTVGEQRNKENFGSGLKELFELGAVLSET